jgi:hypothetical protein
MELYAQDARFVAPTGETLVGRTAISAVLTELIAAGAQMTCNVVRAHSRDEAAHDFDFFARV